MAATFVDRAVLHVSGGNGGNGCTSVHREKFKPLGGPDGGTGGRGGNVVLVVDPSVTTLLDLHRHPHKHAGNGKPGQGSMRDGAEGEDLLVAVPDGTVVRDSETGEVLVDLVGGETTYVVARGGRGGLGNAALASARRACATSSGAQCSSTSSTPRRWSPTATRCRTSRRSRPSCRSTTRTKRSGWRTDRGWSSSTRSMCRMLRTSPTWCAVTSRI